MIRRNGRRARKPKPVKGGGGGGGLGGQNPPAVPPAATFVITRDALDQTITYFNFSQPVTYQGTIPGWSVFGNPPRFITTIQQTTPLFATVKWSGTVSVNQTIDCGNGSKAWRTQLGGAIVGGAHKVAAES